MLALIRREPVAFGALVHALIALVIAFGLNVTPGEVGAVMAFESAVIGFLVRSRVVPVVKVRR